ncbi:MAG: CinA family protein [Rhodospirillales bacterium]|nr:CinA family protein [Rhodospirillales bacterium]
MFDSQTLDQAKKLLEICREKNLRIATAESCTGGLIGGCLTAVPGSSDYFDRAFITYTNHAKVDMLDVSEEILKRSGAVCAEVAMQMADGALKNSGMDLTVSATGIAGPDGGRAGKPVGLVQMAAARKGFDTIHKRCIFSGDRDNVRLETVKMALNLLDKQARR